MPHQQSRRQETRCRLPGGEVIFVEEGSDCPGISGQQGSARRRLFWAEEGAISSAPANYPPWWNTARIGAAPQRPPARPGGPLPGDRSYSPGAGRREEGVSQRLPDDRPAYRGGGYGFPKISQARQGDERGRGLPRSNQERAERHGYLYPGTPLPERGTGLGISQEYAPVTPTIWRAVLAGLGLGVGFAVVNKIAKS